MSTEIDSENEQNLLGAPTMDAPESQAASQDGGFVAYNENTQRAESEEISQPSGADESQSGNDGRPEKAAETEKVSDGVASVAPARREKSKTPAVDLVAFGCRVTFLTAIVCVLLFACILCFSPYTAMRMYTKLGNRDMALQSAEKYLRWNDDELRPDKQKYPHPFGKYTNALYSAANNSVYFMHKNLGAGKYRSRTAKYYARKVARYAGNYVDNNDMASLLPRSDRIDAYSLAHTAPALHPYVYRYADTLSAERFTAWYILEEYAVMNTHNSELTTQWDQEGWTPAESDFLLLTELSAYINAELDNLGLSDLIANKTSGVLLRNDIPADFSLYGKNKPFDLFVYDANDVDVNGDPLLNSDIFSPLYRAVSEVTVAATGGQKRNNFALFVDFIRQNAVKYARDGAEPNRAEHLRYTYLLHTLVDFWRAMNNMTAVLAAKENYFPEQYRSALQAAYNFYQTNSYVSNVRMYRDGAVTSGGYIYNWYDWGMLPDYLAFYSAA